MDIRDYVNVYVVYNIRSRAMKLWSNVHIFNHPWEVMVEAAYRKYPNPYNPNVKSLDTLERRVTPGRLFSHRLFCTMWSIPTIVLKIVGTNPVMQVNEQSLCNLENKTLTICARNLTLSSLFTLDETLVYSVNPEDPNTTTLTQTAKISVFGIPLIGSMLEGMLISSYGATVSQVITGRMGVEAVAKRIREELGETLYQ